MTPYELPESPDLQDKIDRLERMVESLAAALAYNVEMSSAFKYDLMLILKELQGVSR